MSWDFGNGEPPADEEKETPEEPAFGWPEPQSSEWQPLWESRGAPPEGEAPPEQLPPPHRTRDPLARLFPGLPRGARVALDWVLTIAGAVLIVLALKQWVVNPYRIPSSSMEPALLCGKGGPNSTGCTGGSSDRVLACRVCLDFSNPSRGDIVVFNTPSAAAAQCGEGGTFVKRVVGLPGETVREDDKGFIWIRGPDSKLWVKIPEPYLSAQRRLADTQWRGKSWHVPKGDYFMMGDNRAESCDSRSWGPVPRHDLIGTVFFVYWPPDRIGFK